MEDMKRLKEMLCRELGEITQTGNIALGDLDAVYKLVVSIEKLYRIEEIEGHSRNSRYSGTNSYGNGSYDNGSYDNGSYRNGSYGNGSNNSGSYGSYGNSRNDSYGHYSQTNEDMRRVIEDMMRNPNTSQSDKDILRRAMDILDR